MHTCSPSGSPLRYENETKGQSKTTQTRPPLQITHVQSIRESIAIRKEDEGAIEFHSRSNRESLYFRVPLSRSFYSRCCTKTHSGTKKKVQPETDQLTNMHGTRQKCVEFLLHLA